MIQKFDSGFGAPARWLERNKRINERPNERLDARKTGQKNERDDRKLIGTRTIEVRHDGEVFRVEVRRMAAARRFILRVRSASRDAVLTMPRRAALREATEFAERNASWIGVRLKRLPVAAPFEDQAKFPFRGRIVQIVWTRAIRGGVRLDDDDPSGPKLLASGDEAHIARRIHDFLKTECRKDLRHSIDRYAARIGVPSPSFSLRDTKSRWGSCSSSGSLNFSWRLIMAPAFVLDYLAAHETCHLRHMNHSPKFWDLCRKICAMTEPAEAWLRAHGHDLYRYGERDAVVQTVCES